MNDDHREAGRIPRTIECELISDLGNVWFFIWALSLVLRMTQVKLINCYHFYHVIIDYSFPVDVCVPGDMTKVTGVVRLANSEERE